MLNLLIALPLAAAMLVTLRWCWKGDTWGVATLLLLCVVWLRVDKAFEGPNVFRVAHNHGLVLSDLLAIVVGASGVVGWLRRRHPSTAPTVVDRVSATRLLSETASELCSSSP